MVRLLILFRIVCVLAAGVSTECVGAVENYFSLQEVEAALIKGRTPVVLGDDFSPGCKELAGYTYNQSKFCYEPKPELLQTLTEQKRTPQHYLFEQFPSYFFLTQDMTTRKDPVLLCNILYRMPRFGFHDDGSFIELTRGGRIYLFEGHDPNGLGNIPQHSNIIPPKARAYCIFDWKVYFMPAAASKGSGGNIWRLHIDHISTTEAYRRKGYGQLLVESAIKLASTNPSTHVITTSVRTKESQELFTKLGFTKFDRSQNSWNEDRGFYEVGNDTNYVFYLKNRLTQHSP